MTILSVVEVAMPIVAVAAFFLRSKVKNSPAYQRRQAAKIVKADEANAVRALAAAASQAEMARQSRDLDFARNGQLQPIEDHGVVLHKGELALALISGASLLEDKVVGFSGKTTGYSVRVAKGLTLRHSGSRGHANHAMVATAKGRLVVTNQRVIFAGDTKSVSMTHKAITAFTPLSDGVRFSDSRKTVSFLIGKGHGQDLFKIAAARLIHEAASQ